MAKKRQLRKPEFAIRPAKNGQSWSVFLIASNGRSILAYEFASEVAAQNWISFDSKTWLRKRETARRA
jgi:hypothetical protein